MSCLGGNVLLVLVHAPESAIGYVPVQVKVYLRGSINLVGDSVHLGNEVVLLDVVVVLLVDLVRGLTIVVVLVDIKSFVVAIYLGVGIVHLEVVSFLLGSEVVGLVYIVVHLVVVVVCLVVVVVFLGDAFVILGDRVIGNLLKKVVHLDEVVFLIDAVVHLGAFGKVFLRFRSVLSVV